MCFKDCMDFTCLSWSVLIVIFQVRQICNSAHSDTEELFFTLFHQSIGLSLHLPCRHTI
ncbi:hypothetical protein M758_9G046800 [Ceratodon purpureus]|nr:hypothetical protein M758_9G046800 [Ceratodon purpureus]